MTLVNLKEYNKIVSDKKYKLSENYFGKKNKELENEFWSRLISLSKHRCFYCGNKITVYNFDREHRIDKSIFSEKYIEGLSDKSEKEMLKNISKELTRSKFNLIPVCKGCNNTKALSKPEIVKKGLTNLYNASNGIKFTSCSNISSLLNKDNFLEELFEVNIISLNIENNLIKTEQLNFRQKIIESMENLMIKNWQYPDSYIEEQLVKKYNQSEENKWYLEHIYYMNFAIFY